MKIGIMAVQGAVEEHMAIVEKIMDKMKIEGNAFSIRKKGEMDEMDALIIPGGESTTISRLLIKFGLVEKISELAKNGLPIMGTCAGCVLLSQNCVGVKKLKTHKFKTLKLMKMEVERNAFGRQRESFQLPIKIKGFKRTFDAVFIRAPVIKNVWGSCVPLASIDDKIVMAGQGNFLATSFHPELTEDTRIHEYFLKMINR